MMTTVGAAVRSDWRGTRVLARRGRATFSLLVIALTSGVASGAPARTDVLLIDHMPAPDGNGRFSYVNGSPVLNDASQIVVPVAFGGTVGGSADNTAIVLADRNSIAMIAREGDAAPDGDGTFATFFAPELNDAGQVGFVATFEGTSSPVHTSGMFRGDGTTVTQLVRRGYEPTDGGGGFIQNFSGLSLNESGTVTFHAYIAGYGSGTWAPRAIFTADGSVVHSVIWEGLAAPNGDGTFLDVASPKINASGRIVFGANLDGTSGGAWDNFGIFAADDAGVTELVREGWAAPLPGGGSNGVFQRFNVALQNDAGEVAFMSDLRETAGGTTDDFGIFLHKAGAISAVLRKGQASPDGDGRVGAIDGFFEINGAGQVAFKAALYEGASGSLEAGVFRGDGDDLELLARVGRPLMAGGIVPLGLATQVSMNDAGQVAFVASFVDEATTTEAKGLFLFDDRLGPILAMATGDALASDVMADVVFGPDALNEAGEVAYRFVLEDGRDGAALWTPPDPIEGDANLDGVVSLADFLILREHFGTSGPDVYFQQADFNGDKAVTLADFLLLRANFGNAGGGDAAAMDAWLGTVPEPATASLLAVCGGLGMLRVRRRR